MDQQALLKARLFDMWINDWDRHEDQWVWLAHKNGKKTVYTPFARDRDNAFFKSDGVNLFLLSRPWALQNLQNLQGKVKNLRGLNLNARFLDRQFLNALTKEDWEHTIRSLQLLLTDTAIENAVNSTPFDVTKISGAAIIKKLKLRRDEMMRFGMKYYALLNKQVDITGSDEKEYFTVNNRSETETEITVQKINKENSVADTLYHKSFNGDTKNIYLYGLNGDDIFSATGNGSNKIKVTIIGGTGKDRFISKDKNESNNKIAVYDSTDNRIVLPNQFKPHFTKDTLFTHYNRRHFKYDWYIPLIIPGFNPDDGVFIGTGIIYKKQHWGKAPYAWQQSFGASVAFKTGATNFFYNGKFRQFFGKWDLELAAAYKGPLFIFNYYGQGNDTKLLTTSRAYNRVRVKQFIANPALSRTFGIQHIKAGAVVEYLTVEENAGKFITDSNAGVNKQIFLGNTFLGANVQYTVGKKDNERYPAKGYGFETALTYKRNITAGAKDFLNIHSSFSFYLPLGKLVFAHRTGAATNFGNYEFYHANTLGGIHTLRGYYRTRFTGQSSFYQNTELRLSLANLKGYVFRGKLGVYGFFDDGRVWVKNESSNTFHTGYGGGIFFLPFNAASLNFSYGHSSEVNVFQFGLDFFF